MRVVLFVSDLIGAVRFYYFTFETFLLNSTLDALNRLSYSPKEMTTDHSREPGKGMAQNKNTIIVMMYIFPRQFGLHNVFTSEVDRRQTTHKFLDYTLRDEEISKKFSRTEDDANSLKVRLPKRLKGKAMDLVRKLQILHSRCPYFELLKHYCPVRFSGTV